MEKNKIAFIQKMKSQFFSERGEIGESFIFVIAIILSTILMFAFPLMTMSDRTDDVVQLTLDTATTEFVNVIIITGKITPDNYDKFLQNITATGNTYDVEIEVQVLDENPGKKATQTSKTTIGENVYYSIYTSQILEVISPDGGTPKTYGLKEGDIISVKVKNTNQTLSQQLKNFFYTVTGKNTYTIASEHAGIVKATGK